MGYGLTALRASGCRHRKQLQSLPCTSADIAPPFSRGTNRAAALSVR